jgi:hypothetical protein
MSPREKASRLVDRYLDEVFNETDVNFPLELPKRLALILVNEMLRNDGWSSSRDEWDTFKKYYEEVKKEIEAL